MTQVSHMTLDDLKTGMIVTLRNKSEFTVIRNMARAWNNSNDIFVYVTESNSRGWMGFGSYKPDLTYNGKDRDWDIVKVEVPVHPFGFMTVDYRTYQRTVIWKEAPAVKLTVAEIEARLGYKIEIVSDDNKEELT